MTSLADDMFISIFRCNYTVPAPTLYPQKVGVGWAIVKREFEMPISQKKIRSADMIV